MLGSEEELRSMMIIGRESGSPRRDSISRYGYLVCVCYVVLSFPTLCRSMDCRLPGFSAHGIF